MTQRLCPRCRSVLHLEDDNTLVFCWNCGAPQVRLSAEMLEAQTPPAAPEPGVAGEAAVGAAEASGPALNRWSGAVQCAGLAGAVAAALTLMSFALPPVALFSTCWVVSAPIIVLSVYAARFRNTRITAGFAARLGVLCGTAILLATASLETLQLFVQRFAFHAATSFDAALAERLAQQTAILNERLGPADAAPALAMMVIPEFRAGLLLCSFALIAVVYLLYSAAAGAFAGMVRSRANAR